ncbi:hypothetical protein Pmani_021800 [Petrolisthes manimaculis]|uniref:Ig-like domain-containing protein n=1 Tax=Petrolisthes manimaculis TaxID=1843537 RepID=A0AAE1PFP5_9EUCA|nr:hypothetical protein Pmani_021800 [Petrolisthes manimaculis]
MCKDPFYAIFLLLTWSSQCLTERVVVNLADGGTSRPILLLPLEHSHDNHGPNIEVALPTRRAREQEDPFDIPNPPSETDTGDTQSKDTVPPNSNNNQDVYTEHNADYSEDREEQNGVDDEGHLSTPKNPQQEIIKTSTMHAPAISTTMNTTTEMKQTTTSPLYKTSTPYSIISPSSPKPSLPPTTLTTPTPLLCHQSCLNALNATTLYTNQTLTLEQGSDLTLICELPINPSLNVENLIWLFHSLGSPEGQCSLTSQRYLASCPGFTTVTNTDDRNATFLRQVLTLANLRENHTGEYFCQVEVTCCPRTQEHPMTQECTVGVTVSVWWADYTLDLAVAGTLAAVLIAILVGVTVWLNWRRRRAYFSRDRKQASGNTTSAVLHLPLIDDDDDSFDSNSDVQE